MHRNFPQTVTLSSGYNLRPWSYKAAKIPVAKLCIRIEYILLIDICVFALSSSYIFFP